MAALDRRDRRHTLSDATLAYILLFSIGSAIGVGMFVVIALSTRRKRRSFGSGGPEPDTEALAHFEKSWLVIAAGALAAVILFTIFVAPYGEAAGPDPQIVNVSGQQFAFVLQPATVKVGQPVEFHLASRDVTHGFAVFDPDGTSSSRPRSSRSTPSLRCGRRRRRGPTRSCASSSAGSTTTTCWDSSR